MTRPHHHFDHFAFGAKIHIATAVNKFAPMKRSVTAATIGYVSPGRAASALQRAERYTYTHPYMPEPVPRYMAHILRSLVDAVART
jgi:hypothetical protein